jgi:hypothetical protein
MQDIINQQFHTLEPFYGKKTINNILVSISNKTKDYFSLSKETPPFEPLQIDSQRIDVAINLYEYYIWRVLTTYIECITDTTLVDKRDRVESMQDIGKLLIAYLGIMEREKEKVDISYEHVADDIFKIQQFEKKKITDRLKAKTDEARQVDNVKKAHK